jgi:hypothetical protein
MTKPKTIKTTDDLPEWFNIAEYEFTEKLDNAGWLMALSQRKTHNYFLSVLQARKKHGGLRPRVYSQQAELYKNLLSLRENPSFCPTDKTQILALLNGEYLIYIFSADTKYAGIEPFTWRKLLYKESLIAEDKKSDLKNGLYEDGKNLSVQLSKVLNTAVYHSFQQDAEYKILKEDTFFHTRNDVVEVDFSLPDKVLIAQFENYIKNRRSECSTLAETDKPQKINFKKWNDFQILPYLDLTLWALENNLTITNRVMAEAIYSEGDNKDTETVRKTTIKLAEKSLYNQTFAMLKTAIV